MKGDAKVIQVLNQVLVGELTAINQYFLHASMCKNWGYDRIARKAHEESIEEMKHAQTLTDRILLIEGLPNFQQLEKINIGETVKEQLESDLQLEFRALDTLRNGIEVCQEARDYTSKEMLEDILKEEEDHVDWLEAQLGMIQDMGYENYLAQQMH